MSIKWPLDNPLRLALTVLGGLIVVIVVGGLIRGPAASGVAPSKPPAVAVAPTATATPTADVRGPEGLDHPDPQSCTAIATAFVTAWARPDLGAAAWLAGVEPYADPRFRAGLGTVDPSRVPATKVTGDALMTTNTGTGATVDVPTDSGTVTVTLVHTANGWSASSVDTTI